MESHTHPIPQIDPSLLARPPRASRPALGLLQVPPADALAPVAGHTLPKARDRAYARWLAVADVLAALLALVVCFGILGDHDAVQPLAFFALPLIVLASKLQGLYDRDQVLIRKTTADEAPQLLRLAVTYAFVVWLFDGMLVEGHLGKEQIVLLLVALFAFTLAGRHLVRRVLERVVEPERLLLIGDAGAYDRLRRKLEHGDTNAELVGRMSLQRTARRGDRATSDPGELDELIAWTRAHRLVIDPQILPPEDMLDFVRAAQSLGVRVSLLPRVLDVVGTSVVCDDLHGMTVLGVRPFGLSRSSWFVKRSFDIAGATVGLLVTAPLLLAVAAAIRIDSRGPVFFRQTRIGRDGTAFRIWKFRTMVVDAEDRKAALRTDNEVDGGLFKIAADPRVTRVGRLLRRTSLDELPQLLNVVRGHMSLVGPRPLVVDEDERITGWDRRRLDLTPGMTGSWQLLGSTKVPLHEMVRMDYLYVSGWSLWSDLKILLGTVGHVCGRRGV